MEVVGEGVAVMVEGGHRRDSSYGHVYGLGALWYFV